MDAAIKHHQKGACLTKPSSTEPALQAHSLSQLLAGGIKAADAEAAIFRDLEAQSFVILRADALSLRALQQAETLLVDGFFKALADETKIKHQGKRMQLVSCGYSRGPQREQWHMACGAEDRHAQPWPSEQVEAAMLDTHLLFRRISIRCLEALLPPLAARSASSLGQLHAACTAGASNPSDPSVLDCFLYGATAVEEKLGVHTDPGIFTVKRVSEVPGVFIRCHDGSWLDVESSASPCDLVVWAADQLATAAKSDGSSIRAVEHCVRTPTGRERSSFVYELRAPESLLCRSCRHGMPVSSCSVCRHYPVG